MTRRTVGVLALACFALTVVAANMALDRWGLVSVGFGLTAPAGVYFAGLAFQLRDLGHERAGIPAVLAAIAVGAVLSALVDPSLALASGVAFTVAELADLAVYTPLRLRSRPAAVFVSGLVGSCLDSWLFLWLAPFPVTTRGVLGLVVGKVVIVWVCTLLLLAVQAARTPEPAPA